MTNRMSRGAIACALLATTSLCLPAIAEAAIPAPQFVDTVDGNGVDLVGGLPHFVLEEGGIGAGPGRVAMHRIWAEGAGFVDNWTGGMFKVTSGGSALFYVQIGGLSDTFTYAAGSGPYTNAKANGATLILQANGNYLYTSAQGTKIEFDPTGGNSPTSCPGADSGTCAVPVSITRPSGLRFLIGWTANNSLGSNFVRLASVASSAGYRLDADYVSDSIGAGPTPNADWFKRSKIRFSNTAISSSTQSEINYSYGANTIDVTGPANRTWRFTTDSNGRLVGARRPGGSSDNVVYEYGTDGLVSSATRDGVTNSYVWTFGSNGVQHTMSRTDPLNHQIELVSSLNGERPLAFTNELGKQTVLQYDASRRVMKITQPEGNYAQFAYDSRGNVTSITNVAKSGSGLSNIVTSASFDTTCSNIVKCNKPNSTTDAKGNVTDYTYDSTHGGLTSMKLPAPSTGADRPETRSSYGQVTSASGDLVYMLTGTSACASGTAPSCVGTANESKASMAYNSNLLATSASRGDGTGTLTATSAMTYDPRGNLLTVDGPLSGTADTTAFKYNAADQLVGTISPDPDGAGTGNPNRAVRLTYRSDGQVSKQELGTTAGQSDSNFSAMTVAQTLDIGFDTNSRPVTSKLSASGTDYGLAQVSYDALGRTECSAVRMNVAAFGSLPSSACDPGTAGSFGPDRISKLVYDAAGQVTEARVAVKATGSADPGVAERTLTYSNNGQLATLKDGEDNLTTFEYDGFDRLSKNRFPVTTKGANSSSTTDYEELTYDANSNVISRRLRDGNNVSFTYDNLDRLTVKGPPNPDPTVTFNYDSLGRLTSAAKSAIGISLAFTYDALGRKLTEGKTDGAFVTTSSSEYDLAGRRTKLTYPGTGLYVNSDYLMTGEVTKVRENGATSGIGVLASYGYDSLGNRTSVAFGNGASQVFTYDAVSRLASLINDLGGTANDLTITINGYNPAGQIIGVARSNDAYAFTGHANATTAYTSNGRNQQATVAGSSASWDSRGNLTGDPTTGKSYTYLPGTDQLWVVSSPFTAMSYDALDRLAIIDSASDTKFVYDGLDTLAEYDGSNALQKRYVFGPGVDQPIVEYDSNGNRRFLSADERGSIISASDSTGASLGINTYDEYGKPGVGNTGRFQYTGQRWIGEAGLYDYKARSYLPGLGIFAQRDPAGYKNSANLYGYAIADPVSFVDPFGLDVTCTGSHIPRDSCGGIAGLTCIGECTNFLSPADRLKLGLTDRFGEVRTAPARDVPINVDLSAIAACAADANACLSLEAAQFGDRTYWGVTQWSRSDTIDTIITLLNKELDVYSVMSSTAFFSVRDSLEYGFWISRLGSDYFVSSTVFTSGEPDLIYPMRMRPAGSDIFFHYHQSLTLPQGLSPLDFGLAERNHFLIISISRAGVLDWADFRR